MTKEASRGEADGIPYPLRPRRAGSPQRPFCHPRSLLGHLEVLPSLQWGSRLLPGAAMKLTHRVGLAPARFVLTVAPLPGRDGQKRRKVAKAPVSAGDCFCLGPRRGGVRASRAPAPRSPSQSGATHAPRSVSRSHSGWLGSFQRLAYGAGIFTPPLSSPLIPLESHASGCSSAPVPSLPPQRPQRVFSFLVKSLAV